MENYNKVEKDKYTICYYLNGELHRTDGPAYRHLINGNREWYQNGKRHRIEGPALECCDGYEEWYYEDQKIDCKTQKEFERLIKLKLFW
jgi:hypothetical protein